MCSNFLQQGLPFFTKKWTKAAVSSLFVTNDRIFCRRRHLCRHRRRWCCRRRCRCRCPWRRRRRRWRRQKRRKNKNWLINQFFFFQPWIEGSLYESSESSSSLENCKFVLEQVIESSKSKNDGSRHIGLQSFIFQLHVDRLFQIISDCSSIIF